ncbi:MAG: phenylacetate-CoA oxygenase subunit PaaJ [Myxococcales bacterium]|nr:phenylacetate-CoA oxygenase subunit PaaJ [Myxococcales bacterium]
MVTPSRAEAWGMLMDVCDPELPFLSVVDLGVIREVRVDEDEVTVEITPTYSGCPAMEVIERDVERRLVDGGFRRASIQRRLSPAWTTDEISERGKLLLAEHGIAPPRSVRDDELVQLPVPCPRCGSTKTELLSAFGSTACKALRRCTSCLEPFDHVKPI